MPTYLFGWQVCLSGSTARNKLTVFVSSQLKWEYNNKLKLNKERVVFMYLQPLCLVLVPQLFDNKTLDCFFLSLKAEIRLDNVKD